MHKLIRELSAVRLFVSDLQRAVEFYGGTLGLKLAEQHESSYAVFQLSNITLLVEHVDPADGESKELVGRFTGVSFSTGDIRAAYERLTSGGVHFNGPPARQIWGGILAHFHDPDHNVLTLVETPPA